MQAEYLMTMGDPSQARELFKDGYLKGHSEPRIAFVGRSNVGKSSLINALLEHRIARVSATPGKTRAIHFFMWPKANRIVVDLPGYGFAKVAKKEQNEWSRLMNAYFDSDMGVEGVILLWDSRIGPTDSDLQALDFFLSKQIAIQILMTKFDQLKTQSERAKRKLEVKIILDQYEIAEDQTTWISTFDQSSIRSIRERFT